MTEKRQTSPLLILLGVGVLVALLALWLYTLEPASRFAAVGDRIQTFATIFLGIFIEAAPFLLLGTLASGIVEVFVRKEDLIALMPRNALMGAVAGGMMGFFFPVCECGVVPLTRRLFSKGLPISIGITFLLAAPVVNPIVLASTANAYGFGPMLYWRFGLSVVIAMVVGLIFSVEKDPLQVVRASSLPSLSGASVDQVAAEPKKSWRERINQAIVIAGDEFFEMGRYLVFGTALASLMQTLVPQELLRQLNSGPLLPVLIMIALAVILSICSTVDAFVSLGFAGFSSGSILAFLVFGPMVDIKSVMLYTQVFKRRTVMYLVLLPFLMSVLAGVFLNLNGSF